MQMDHAKKHITEVIKFLKSLNSSKALGPDELHPSVLKELGPELGTVLVNLFHQSVDTGEIPKEQFSNSQSTQVKSLRNGPL